MGADASIREAAFTATDSRGSFAFPAVPAGQYTIVAWRTGGVPTGDPQKPFADPRRVAEMSGAWARQAVTVGAGRPTTNVSVTLREPVAVSGRVVFEGSSERPAAGNVRSSPVLTVIGVSPLFRTPGPFPAGRFDASDGRFTIRGVSPPGRYLLGIPAVAAPWVLQSVTVGGRDATDAAFDVGDAELSDVIVTFSDRPATLSGSVTGAPAGDSTSVFLFPAGKSRWPDARSSMGSFRTVRVSKNGTFGFGSVLPGDYLIAAIADEAAGDWPDEKFLTTLAGVATPLRILGNQSTTATVRVGALK